MTEKYYWMRLNSDFFTSKRIKKLRKLGGDYLIIYLKMQLKSLKQDGYLYYAGLEENIADEIALDIDEDSDKVQLTLAYLQSCGLLETQQTGDIFLPYVEKLTGSETASAERVRKHRAKQKALQCNTSVTECNAPVTNCNVEIEIEKEIKKEIEYRDRDIEIDKEKENPEKKSINCFSKNFLSFLETYPEKRIDNNTDALYQVFMEYVPDQETWQKIETALPIQVNSKDWHNENGKYIPLASNYLKNRKWDDVIIPPAPLKNAEPNPNRFLTGKFGSISRY